MPETCGVRFDDNESVRCVLPAGHEGPHAAKPPCTHQDEHGAPTLFYFHDGSRCTQCGEVI